MITLLKRKYLIGTFCFYLTAVIPRDDGDRHVLRGGISNIDDSFMSQRGDELMLRGINTFKSGRPDGLSNRDLKLCAR